MTTNHLRLVTEKPTRETFSFLTQKQIDKILADSPINSEEEKKREKEEERIEKSNDDWKDLLDKMKRRKRFKKVCGV